MYKEMNLIGGNQIKFIGWRVTSGGAMTPQQYPNKKGINLRPLCATRPPLSHLILVELFHMKNHRVIRIIQLNNIPEGVKE